MPRPLANQICFTLYATSMAINRTYKPMLDEMGITYPQYLMLSVLGEEDGLTIGAIANRLALDSSTITPSIKRLERAGLVSRLRSQQDERQVQARLTDAGRALLTKCDCLGDALIDRSGMTAEQVEALNQEVQSLRDALTTDQGANRPRRGLRADA